MGPSIILSLIHILYAIKVAPGIHHAMGGVRINANNQALDSDGNPIPGL